MNGFLLQVSNKAVACLRRDEIRDEHGVVEYPLGGEDQESHHPTWPIQLQECEEMHSLIIRLLQQRFDPTLVLFESPD